MSPIKQIHSSQYAKQPLWFKGINSLWGLSYPLGTKSKLEKESLKKAAIKASGLDDFGDFWEEPLDRMLDSINKEAQLHPIGRFITQQRIINLLAVRLRAEYYFKKYPEILEQEVYPIMMIVGLQRTGTTKLQRLLASDPSNRALLSWEALNPAPIKEDDPSNKERIKIAKTSVKALQLMSPGFFAIHPIEYDAPEEDVLLLDVSFLSTTVEATMHVPSYAKWLENTDQSSAYAYMAKLLKLLQWQRPAKRWVLKTPHHLEFLNLASSQFKDIQFIWTHRNVSESIPSFLSMVAFSRSLFSNAVDPKQVAEHWVRKTNYMLQKAMDHHKKKGAALFTDVPYEELIRDAQDVLKKIYTDRGEDISPDLLEQFIQAEKMNPKGKYGKHIYDLDDFGIDSAYINSQTEEYQRFQLSKKEN
jgi:hypothetical protein